MQLFMKVSGPEGCPPYAVATFDKETIQKLADRFTAVEQASEKDVETFEHTYFCEYLDFVKPSSHAFNVKLSKMIANSDHVLCVEELKIPVKSIVPHESALVIAGSSGEWTFVANLQDGKEVNMPSFPMEMLEAMLGMLTEAEEGKKPKENPDEPLSYF